MGDKKAGVIKILHFLANSPTLGSDKREHHAAPTTCLPLVYASLCQGPNRLTVHYWSIEYIRMHLEWSIG